MINILDVNLCLDAAPILRIVGYVVLGIEIVVPIMLIIVGMLDLAKAVNEKSEDKIKKAQQELIKKAISAVLVFLVIFFVKLIMGVVGNDEYESCMDCIKHPAECSDGSEYWEE